MNFFSKTEISTMAVIVGLLVAAIWGAVHLETVTMREGYAAWVKQTGNPKQLSLEEWKALVRATKASESSTFIYIQP